MTYNANDTDISKMKCVFTSDSEGYDIKALIKKCKIASYDYVFVCGDIIDSTFVGTYFTDKTIQLFDLKSNNLKNILEVIKDGSKIKMVFGNRDLNKLKCKDLSELTVPVTAHDYIDKFNNNTISFDRNSYNNLKKQFTARSLPFRIANMNNWYTFWTSNPVDATTNKKTRNWSIDIYNTEIKSYPFLIRFYDIFGVDNNIKLGGTMSAPNLLFTIPGELGKLDQTTLSELLNFVDNSLNKLMTEPSANLSTHTISLEQLDYYAFIVLSVFRSMISKNDQIIKADFQVSYIKTAADVNGWLYKLYTMHKPCIYLHANDKHILLSHGGVPYDALNHPDKFGTLYDNFIKSTTENNFYKELLTDADKYYKSGGYYNKNNTNSISIDNLKIGIKTINDFFSKVIQVCYTDMSTFHDKPTDSMTIINMLTTGFACTTFVANRSNKTVSLDCNTHNLASFESIGPIMSGMETMRDKCFTLSALSDAGKTVYQIFGHKPAGFGVSIDCFSDSNNQKAININLDTSNSFLGTTNNKLFSKGTVSQSYLIFTNNMMTITTKIYATKFTETKQYDKTTYNINSASPTLNTSLYYSYDLSTIPIITNKDDIEMQFYEQHIDNDLFTLISNTGNVVNGASIFYHGHTIINSKRYHVFSHIKGFAKNLLILNDADFMAFCNVKDLTLKGGSYNTNINSNYYYKYLKYKHKYMHLTNKK